MTRQISASQLCCLPGTTKSKVNDDHTIRAGAFKFVVVITPQLNHGVLQTAVVPQQRTCVDTY